MGPNMPMLVENGRTNYSFWVTEYLLSEQKLAVAFLVYLFHVLLSTFMSLSLITFNMTSKLNSIKPMDCHSSMNL